MVRASLLLASLCLCLAAPAAWPCGNSMNEFRQMTPEQRLLAQANSAFSMGDHAQALAKATRVMEMGTPGGVTVKRAQRLAGEAALRSGKFQEAVGYLQPFGGKASDDAYYRCRLAEARVGAGQAVEAVPVLEELAKGDLMPDAFGWVALAKGRLAQGDRPGALAAVDEALKRDKRHAEARALKAELSKPPPAQATPVKAQTHS